MFRVTEFISELDNPSPAGPRRDPPGPVVVWNLIRRCNLTCRHCYTISADTDFHGELSKDEVFTVLDELKRFKVPALILSGGEPLLRPDIFEIATHAKDMGFYVALSSNGTLIDDDNIEDIARVGFDYIGVSIDGLRQTHDTFRRMEGAFDASMDGIDKCVERGLKVGLRFTLTQDNADDLPGVLDLLDTKNVERFYLSHLNYAGRGNKNRAEDAHFQVTRNALDLLFDRCLNYIRSGTRKEFVTGNNDADGVYMLHWIRQRFPDKADHMQAKLVQWGGNASGVNIANIDNLGNVHPDTMWWNHTLGNVKDRPFSQIWMDTSDDLMAGFKQRPRPVKGRCKTCGYLDICGGNSRVRAAQTTGDPWAEDPGCYLNDEEIR